MRELGDLSSIILILYGASLVAHLQEIREGLPQREKLWGFIPRRLADGTAHLCFEIGFLLHTVLIFAEARGVGFYLPVTTLREVVVFFAWSLAFVYVVLLRRLKQESFGLVVLPFLIFFLIASFFIPERRAIPTTYFSNYYFFIHILTAFFAYASFTISFAACVLYLIQSDLIKSKRLGRFYERLPSLQELEGFIFRSVIWGFLLLGMGIATGSLWSWSAFRTWMVREPKAVASILTWIVYGAILLFHRLAIVRGRRSVIAASFAFGFVLFTFLGTSLFGTQLHVGI